MASRDASDVILRNDYRTRYINYYVRQQGTYVVLNILGGSGAANEASEVTYLTMGRTQVTNEELVALNAAPGQPPVIGVSTLYYNPLVTPISTVVTSNGVYMTDGTSLYNLSSETIVSSPDGIRSLAVDPSGQLYIASPSNIYRYTTGFSNLNITGLTNIATFAVATAFYIVEQGSSTILKALSNSAAAVIAGSTPGFADGSPGKLKTPQGLTLDSTGQFLYIADTGNSLIRKMSTSVPYTLSTVAGSTTEFFNPFPTDSVGNRDGNGLNGETLLYSPQGITGSTTFYIADTANNNIRSLRDGNLTTISGQSGTPPVYEFSPPGYTDASLSLSLWTSPTSIFLYGSTLYVTEPANHAVRVIPLP